MKLVKLGMTECSRDTRHEFCMTNWFKLKESLNNESESSDIMTRLDEIVNENI